MTKWFTFIPDDGTPVFDSRNFKLFIKKIHRPLMPPVSTNQIKAGNRAGAYLQQNTFEPYEIEVEILLMSDTDELLRKDLRALALALYRNKSGNLTFSDERDVFLKARVSGGFELDNFAAMGEGSLTFLIGDPFAYKITETQIAVPAGAAEQLVFIDGYRTFPRFQFTPKPAAISTIRIDNATTGKMMLLTADTAVFYDQTPYIIDHEKNLVYRWSNGERMMKWVDITSDFFPLEKGENRLTFTNPTTYEVVINFRDRFL